VRINSDIKSLVIYCIVSTLVEYLLSVFVEEIHWE